MAHETTLLLLRAALCTGLAIIVLLCLRRPLRRWLGAVRAYQAWLIVPAVAAAALLPIGSAAVVRVAPVLRPVQALARQAAPLVPAAVDGVLLAWAGGALLCACWFAAAHCAFLRRAGRLVRVADVYVAEGDVGPASVGLWRPRIVVPADFAQRYAPSEQALIIAHERVHIARRDALANLLAAAFQCVFWFNPLVHLGARCLRLDQEIACDAAVMRAHPRQRRAYAEALLKCHTPFPLPRAGLNCQWQAHHPTKERLMSLQLPSPGITRRIAGRCVLAVLAAAAIGATLGARAEQAAAAPVYAVALTLDAGGEQAAPRLLAKAGEPFAVASGAWRIEMTVRPGQAVGTAWVSGKLLKNGTVVSAPTLLARVNEKATVQVADGGEAVVLSVVVAPQS